MIAEVIVNHKSKKVDKTFDYIIPEELEEKIRVGSCIIVPFGAGNKPKEAYVTAIKEKSHAKKLKTAERLSNIVDIFEEIEMVSVDIENDADGWEKA